MLEILRNGAQQQRRGGNGQHRHHSETGHESSVHCRRESWHTKICLEQQDIDTTRLSMLQGLQRHQPLAPHLLDPPATPGLFPSLLPGSPPHGPPARQATTSPRGLKTAAGRGGPQGPPRCQRRRSWSRLRRRTSPPSRLFRPPMPPLPPRKLQPLPPRRSLGAQQPPRLGAWPPGRQPHQLAPLPALQARQPPCKVRSRAISLYKIRRSRNKHVIGPC